MDSLGFKPQKEIIYNRFLPYSEVLNDEAKKQLAEIKFNLGRAVSLKEPRPGVIFWCNQLNQYVYYGLLFILQRIHQYILLNCLKLTQIVGALFFA